MAEKAKSAESWQSILTPSKEVKAVMDHFVFLTAEKSVELDVPLQIHVGMGDAPIIDLRIANPILLHDFITDDSLKKAKLVLTHGGYPWIEEAGFLVNSYPNVFLDLSETIPFISIGIADKLMKLFEMTPTNKIMYGSDGYNIPELFWISALETKRSLSRVLNELVESNTIDVDWALEIAEQILSMNTKRIYKL
jgi:predicted TIM-barrel fold metal-dependent hydrolase